jgi:tetratricopeptide (TPR) repeat protein
MRKLLLFPLMALCLFFGRAAHADDRADARTHYQSGVKLYNGGDYRGAIKEFSAAQQLLPADLNNYNLALCYDKLGDAEPAMQYYKTYLNAVPNTDKRAEIEASINRLDAAVKSAGAKAEADRKAQADADAQRKAEEDRHAAEQQQHEQLQQQMGQQQQQQQQPQQPVGQGAAGAPSTGQVQSTGDAQLDTVQGVDIGALRSQRGFAGQGQGQAQGQGQMQQQGAVGAVPPNGQGQIQANGQMPMNAQAGAPQGAQGQAGPMQTNPAGQPLPGDKPAQAEPVYKKWWFWVVVGVSAYVVYEIASDNSQNQVNRTGRESTNVHGGKGLEPSPGGFTLLRW